MTQDELKKILDFDPDTGLFRWKKTLSNRALSGSIAGTYHKSGYISISINGRSYYAHRLAWLYMNGEFPDRHIDHINHVSSDNSISNLRCVDDSENAKNQTMRTDNTTGVTGVYWYRPGNKWRACISVNKKYIHIGYYDDFQSAVKARKDAEQDYNFHENHGKTKQG